MSQILSWDKSMVAINMIKDKLFLYFVDPMVCWFPQHICCATYCTLFFCVTGEVLGLLCQSQGIQIYLSCQEELLQGITGNLERTDPMQGNEQEQNQAQLLSEKVSPQGAGKVIVFFIYMESYFANFFDVTQHDMRIIYYFFHGTPIKHKAFV